MFHRTRRTVLVAGLALAGLGVATGASAGEHDWGSAEHDWGSAGHDWGSLENEWG